MVGVVDDLVSEGVEDTGITFVVVVDGVEDSLVVIVVDEVVILSNIVELIVTTGVGITSILLELFLLEPITPSYCRQCVHVAISMLNLQ